MKAEDMLGAVAGQLVGGVIDAVFRVIQDSQLSTEQQEAALNVLDAQLVLAVGRVQARRFKDVPEPKPTVPGGG